MPSSSDRFYLMEFRNRPVQYGDIGSLLRIKGVIVGGGGAEAHLYLPGERLLPTNITIVNNMPAEEWSDFIHRSDDPEILVGPAKVFQRKLRWEISSGIQQKVWAADGFRCMYCGSMMGNTLLTIDHFQPLELGGRNDVTNFLSACKPCNKAKGSMAPMEWVAFKKTLMTYEQYFKYLLMRKVV
jgi:HNH endonuclease